MARTSRQAATWLVLGALAYSLAWLSASAQAATNVAVFNFQMTSETPEWRWLQKGLSDRIATDFVQDRGLSVVARDRMQMLAQKMNWVPEMATTDAARMKEIRKALKIEQLISGVYAVADGRIRITGQIVDVEGRMELARKEVEGPAEQVLDLQRQLSAELLAWFTKKEPAQILATLPVWTRSLPAAKALYEGMDLYDQGRYAEAWLKFRQASRKDPAYVEAEYWVGKMYYFMNRYAHARRAIERFVYLDTTHPRIGDAMVEYVHTYEATGAPADALLRLYADLAKRFPNAPIWQGRSWGHLGDLRSDDWFRYKRIHLLTQIGRHEEVVRMCNPVLGSSPWYPESETGVCRYPYGVVNLMAHHQKTGKIMPFEIFKPTSVMNTRFEVIETGEEEAARWLRFSAKGRAMVARKRAFQIVGKAAALRDRNIVAGKSSASLAVGLEAPSGYVFTALRFKVLGEGKDGYVEIKLRRPDNALGHRGRTPPERAAFADACSKGIHFAAPPRLGMLIAECGFYVDRPESGITCIKGVEVEPTLARIDNPGTLDVSCRNTSEFCVYVDGAMMRWYPGQVGPLSPGTHEVRLVPVGPGTPYGESSMTVTVRSGQTTPVLGRLPWAEGSPWASWTSTSVPVGRFDPNPSLWYSLRGARPAIQADDKALRFVWSHRGNLWSSESTDGETFSLPRRLDLPVSSGWNEFAPRLVRHESGQFILTFLSDRDGQHRNLPYVCWSRDFVHWSRPSLIVDESLPEDYGLLQDDRGRLVLSFCAFKRRGVLVSSDRCRWTLKKFPGRVLMQDRTGTFHAYTLVRKSGKTDWQSTTPHTYDLYGWTSNDLDKWSRRKLLGKFDLDGEFPDTRGLFALEGKSGPLLMGFGSADRWSLGLCEPRENGRWQVTGRVWGLLPESSAVAYHPRWGYLMAAVSGGSHEWWPRERSGPYLLRGPDLDALRHYRNPLPPLAYQKSKLEIKLTRDSVGDVTGRRLSQRITESLAPPSVPQNPVGTLAYTPLFCSKWNVLKGSEHFAKSSPGCGTVHPQARVVTSKAGDRNVSIALDAEKTDAQIYDVIRLDLTGKGDFRNALIIPRIYLSRLSPGFRYEFAERFPSVSFGGREIALSVAIDYVEGASLGSAEGLVYRLGTCAVGECRFGENVYRVRFHDKTGNLSVRDVRHPAITPDARHPTSINDYIFLYDRFDWFCVDRYRDGKKIIQYTNVRGSVIRYGGRPWVINKERIPRAIYGQPVLVDGQWWDVRVSEDGCHVSAEPCTRPMAWIQLDHTFWQMVLVGEHSVLQVQGGKEPVPVPAGLYRVFSYKEYRSPDPDFTSDRLSVATGFEQDGKGSGLRLDLEAGTTTPVRLGSPLRATAKVTEESGSLRFNIQLADVAGRRAHAKSIFGNRRIPIRVVLTDSSGRQAAVFEATNYYELKNRGWKIPPGFSGTYTVTLEFPGNFPTGPDPVTFTIH